MNREIHGGILRKVLFAHLIACEFTGWLYSKSVLQGEDTNSTNPSPIQMYLLLNVLNGFLLPRVFLIDVMLFTNLRVLHCPYFPVFSLCTAKRVPSSPNLYSGFPALPELCWKLCPE